MKRNSKSQVPDDLSFIQATYLTTRDWELQREICPKPDTLASVCKDIYEMSNILLYLSHLDSVSQPMTHELAKMSRDIWRRLNGMLHSINHGSNSSSKR